MIEKRRAELKGLGSQEMRVSGFAFIGLPLLGLTLLSCSSGPHHHASPDSPAGLAQSKQAALVADFKQNPLIHLKDVCSPRDSSPARTDISLFTSASLVVMKKNDLTESRPGEKNYFSPKSEHDQQAIFNVLSQLIDSGKIKTIVTPNCKNQLLSQAQLQTGTSQMKYMGWTQADLNIRADSPELDRIRVPVLLKLQVKYKNKLNIECFGSEELEEKALLKLSDLRGSAGFYLRLKENRGNALKTEMYLSKARELYRIPMNASVNEAIDRILAQAKISLTELDQINQQRFELFKQRIESLTSTELPVMVLINGTEISDMQSYLERSGQHCQLLETKLYKDSEESAIRQLRDLTK